MRIKQAVIVGGGAGSRLTSDGIKTPKLLLEFDGHRLFELQALALKAYGITSIHYLLGVGASQIIRAIADSELMIHFQVTYSIESSALGTGGALTNAAEDLDDAFVLIYGDVLFDTNLDTLFNGLLNADGALLTRPTDHMFDSDLIEVDIEGVVTGFYRKPHDSHPILRNRANTGVYAFKKQIVTNLIQNFGESNFDLDSMGIPFLIEAGLCLRAVKARGFIRDVGTVGRITTAHFDWLNRIRPNEKAAAIFLDRDGVINRPNGHISTINDFDIFPESVEAIALLKNRGFKVVVVTNQPVLARGEITWKGLEGLHAKLDGVLSGIGTYVDDYYICPHYPESGFEGEIVEWKIECNCRKPKAGLILQAQKEHYINIEDSWFVGDQLTDLQAADSAGLRFAAVGIEDALRKVQPHFKDLISFARDLVFKDDNLS
jgi:D,D-heptose 1,7-bisphosphate phosphatase